VLVLGLAGCQLLGALPGDFPGESSGGPPALPNVPLLSTDAGAVDAPDAGPSDSDLPPRSMVRRLSRTEFDNTLRDVVLEDQRPANRFITEDVFTPFDNDYTTQTVSASLVDSLEALATDVAARTLADPARRAVVVPCVPTGAGDEACFRQTIETLGRKLFRRAMTAEDVDPYVTLLAYATEDNSNVTNDFYTAVDLLIRAILMDPEFLYRIEVGTPTATAGVVNLTPYEVASRMAFVLWGTTPDDQLLDDAETTALTTSEGRHAVATRMLADARAREQLHRFHAMWLGYRTMPVEASLVAAFRRETDALLDRVIFTDQSSYVNVFQSSETYLDPALATHYGLPAPTGAQGWVPYGDSGRGGILSHGSVLSAFSKFTDTSPTQRGILIITRLQCTDVSAPPPDVQVDQPPAGGNAVCKEDRYLEHTQSTSCAACHTLMDPIGFGLENYDISGRFRAHDNGLPECTIRGQGLLPGVGNFSGPKQLADMLVQTQDIQRCVVRQFNSFMIGRPVKNTEFLDVDRQAAAFEQTGFNLQQWLAESVSRQVFAQKREEVAP